MKNEEIENSIQKEWDEITQIKITKVIHPDGTVSGSVGCGGMTSGIDGKDMKIEEFVNLKRANRLKDILNDDKEEEEEKA